MEFKNPHVLWFLITLPLLYYYMYKKEREGTFDSSIFSFFHIRKTFRLKLLFFSKFLLIVSLGLLFFALARPQKGYIEDKLITEGIDIVLAVDISSSMKAEDFKPNRLGAANNVAKEFIEGRKTDKIGLVVFSRQAITQSPLTIDHGILYNFIDTIEIGMIQDGTAIGNAIAEASKRLKYGEEKNKVLILLTDGVNNSGEIDPLTAAQAAEALGIKVYTIGVGTKGNAPYPVDDPAFGKRYVQIPVQIDEEVLIKISATTGGRYFRATDTTKLEEIYREIDMLEKSKIEIKQYKQVREWFVYPLVFGILLFGIYLVFKRVFLRVFP
jgi:Ca-activated chloride channel family protein